MVDKKKIRLAKASGTIESLRNDEISREISSEVPYPAQIAIVMNALEHLYAKMLELYGEDFRTEEWKMYEELR